MNVLYVPKMVPKFVASTIVKMTPALLKGILAVVIQQMIQIVTKV